MSNQRRLLSCVLLGVSIGLIGCGSVLSYQLGELVGAGIAQTTDAAGDGGQVGQDDPASGSNDGVDSQGQGGDGDDGPARLPETPDDVTPRDTARVFTAVIVSPEEVEFTSLGQTAQITLTGVLSDGKTRDVSKPAGGATYSNSGPAVISVDAAGLITAVGEGGATIVASSAGFSQTIAVSVRIAPVELARLEITPVNILLTQAGAQAQLTVEGVFSDDTRADLTGGRRDRVR